SPEADGDPRPQLLVGRGPSPPRGRLTRQLRQRHRGDRDAEQTDGQDLDQLRIAKRRDAAWPRERAEQRVDEPRELGDPRPRHQAEITISPAMGNRMRTSVMVSWRRGSSKPCAITVVIAGARAIPSRASTPDASTSNPRIAPARARAAALSGRSLSAAYTGMNDPASVPSLSRLRMVLGIRSAARKASAGMLSLPK